MILTVLVFAGRGRRPITAFDFNVNVVTDDTSGTNSNVVSDGDVAADACTVTNYRKITDICTSGNFCRGAYISHSLSHPSI